MEKHGEFQQVLDLSRGLLSVRCALKPPQRGARRSRPDQMPEQPQLAPFDMYMQWLDLSLPQISELLTLSLRLSPASLRRKLILASCGRDLILTVTTQTSVGEGTWMDWYTERWQCSMTCAVPQMSQQTACPSCSSFPNQSWIKPWHTQPEGSNPLFSSREPWPQSLKYSGVNSIIQNLFMVSLK